MIKLIAFDLDGTLTQHRTPLGDENRGVLDALGKKYALLMVGAGACMRIHNQMGGYPIDIIGNYGLGGNDEPVFRSEFGFQKIDDYSSFG
jgi:hydroxymethylpyrimidine pyrophosphatase-like HAD family hydrolase